MAYKEPKWTTEQRDAIERDGVNILVSAAAGSGKTTVLVARILRLIIEEEVDVDRFLITTFTNAAASEMREKLKNRIEDEIGELDRQGGDPERKKFLQEQIRLLPDAHIETFHSFAISIIRDYFFLTDLQPGFSIGDETRVNLVKKEVIDDIFEGRFREDTDRFKAFLRKYSKERSDESLKENILSVYGEMLSIPHYMEWAEDRVAKLSEPSPIKALGIDDFIRAQAKTRLLDAADCYDEAARLLEGDKTKKIHAKAKEDAVQIRAIADSIRPDHELRNIAGLLDAVKLNRMAAAKDEKPYYEEVKEDFQALRQRGKKYTDDLKKAYLKLDPDAADELIVSLHQDTEYYLGILKEVEEELARRKMEENIIDFDDAMHYAIRILEDDAAAADYRDRFDYIFIDEYQDSNYLQEEIVDRIKSENNLFMVGDIKQSIYRFRLAEPELFRKKYTDFGREEVEDSAKIDLNSNFRSKGNIRRAVNTIFRDVMDGYDENAALKGPEGGGPEGPETELHIIRKYKVDVDPDEEEQREELDEAALISEIIEKYVGTSYTDRNGDEQKLRYSDIAVLSRGGSAVSRIESHLNGKGIPAFGDTEGGYYETVEVRVFIDLLKVISNMRQDVPLIAVMSAIFFDFGPEDLAKIRIRFREGTFCDAVFAYAEEGDDPAIRRRIVAMIDQIRLWREMSRTLPLEELARILIYETGYYDYCSSLPMGERRLSNLRLLMEKAQTFEKTSYSGLFGFLSYIEAMKKSRQKVNEASVVGEGEDVVRVMTVHKSKGLEYPMVILVGAGKRISGSSTGFSPALDREFSIGLPLIDKKMHSRSKTILQQAIIGKKKTEELEEETRILYVALTRAIDRLIVVGSVSETKKLSDVPSKGSFLEMLYPAMKRLWEEDPAKARVRFYDSIVTEPGDNAEPGAAEEPALEPETAEPSALEPETAEPSALEAETAEPPATEPEVDRAEFGREVNRRLSFRYPYEYTAGIRPKYTVTALAAGMGGHVDPDEPEDLPTYPGEGLDITMLPPSVPKIPDIRNLEAEEAGLTAAETGTVMHYIMEKIDFAKAAEEGVSYVKKVAAELHEAGVLDDMRYEAVKPGNIAAFFDDPVGKRAAEAKTLRKEKEFLLQEMVEGEPVIVQGVIDCYFQEDDGLVLIDYKNSFLRKGGDPSEIVDRYREQIRIYKRALEKAEDRPVKESWLYLFRSGDFVAVDTD